MVTLTLEDETVFRRLTPSAAINHRLRRMMTAQYETCVSCQEVVTRGRPLFAGYDGKGDPWVVGACCASKLQSLATPVYPEMNLNVSVPEAVTIWRYMDFAKFAAMLQSKGVFFPRADKLDDAFEGAAGLARREGEWDAYYLDFFRESIASRPSGLPLPSLTPEQLERQAQNLLQSMKAASAHARSLLVSCWHANEIESEALWRLYCANATPGIAIRSTVGSFGMLARNGTTLLSVKCGTSISGIVSRLCSKIASFRNGPHFGTNKRFARCSKTRTSRCWTVRFIAVT